MSTQPVPAPTPTITVPAKAKLTIQVSETEGRISLAIWTEPTTDSQGDHDLALYAPTSITAMRRRRQWCWGRGAVLLPTAAAAVIAALLITTTNSQRTESTPTQPAGWYCSPPLDPADLIPISATDFCTKP
jgi:hypothetical protein